MTLNHKIAETESLIKSCSDRQEAFREAPYRASETVPRTRKTCSSVALPSITLVLDSLAIEKSRIYESVVYPIPIRPIVALVNVRVADLGCLISRLVETLVLRTPPKYTLPLHYLLAWPDNQLLGFQVLSPLLLVHVIRLIPDTRFFRLGEPSISTCWPT